MAEHLSAEQIERYRRRAMPPTELLAADDHLVVCEVCRQQIRDETQWPSAVASLQADLESARADSTHLSYEQLAAYCDDSLNEVDREIVQSHLESCPPCAAEAADLRALADTMKTHPVKAYSPPSLLDKLQALWRRPGHWTLLQWAGTAMMALLLTAFAVGLFVRKSTRLGGLQKEESAQSAHPTPAPGGATQAPDHKAAQATAPAQPTQPKRLEPLPETVPSLNLGGGRRLTLNSQGQIAGIESYPATLRQMIQATVRARRVMVSPVVASLIGRPRTSRSGSDPNAPFDLISPAGTVVSTDAPTLRWQPWKGVTGYTAQIIDAKQREVERSPLLSETQWTPAQPLPRGGTYTWQVTAIREGEEYTASTVSGRKAKFKVLEQAKADELTRARARYTDSPLVLGILYAEAGLLDDAQQQFEALAEANRNASPAARALTQKLLEDLQALRSAR